MEQALSWEASTCRESAEIRSTLWNRMFITVFTRARHCSLSCATRIQFTTFHNNSLKSILIFFFYLWLGLLSCVFLHYFLPKLCLHLTSFPCVMCQDLIIFIVLNNLTIFVVHKLQQPNLIEIVQAVWERRHLLSVRYEWAAVWKMWISEKQHLHPERR
jgi:hypothetical protein